jgi:hypothetical protein
MLSSTFQAAVNSRSSIKDTVQRIVVAAVSPLVNTTLPADAVTVGAVVVVALPASAVTVALTAATPADAVAVATNT